MDTLNVSLPPGLDPATARLALALGLFQEEEVSVGKAAEIAGLSYRAFLDALHARGISAYTYTDEMLDEDLAFVRRFREDRRL
ncbi:MAG: UPF0175 family protein [Bacteroidota bacterium]